MLLAILALALASGRVVRRITPAVDLLLFLGVAAIVLAQLVAWKAGVDFTLQDFLRGQGSVAR